MLRSFGLKPDWWI